MNGGIRTIAALCARAKHDQRTAGEPATLSPPFLEDVVRIGQAGESDGSDAISRLLRLQPSVLK